MRGYFRSLKAVLTQRTDELSLARAEIEAFRLEKEGWRQTEAALRERIAGIEKRCSPARSKSPKSITDTVQRELVDLRGKLTFEKAERRKDADCMDAYLKELQGIVALLRKKASKSPNRHPPAPRGSSKTPEKRDGRGEREEELMENEREKVGGRQLLTQLACIPEGSRSLANKRRRLAVELELSVIEANLMAWKQTHSRTNQ